MQDAMTATGPNGPSRNGGCTGGSRLHVALIMDGNGRWAANRGLPRSAGHAAGVETVRRVVEAAPNFGIGTLSLYAFSADNWRRPAMEVGLLFDLLRRYLKTELRRLCDAGVRIKVVGRRDRLPDGIAASIADAEAASAHGRELELRIALDYSARDAIIAAARAAASEGDFSRDRFQHLIGGGEPLADVDLLIRTSGEQRLSDFMLWECAYAELYFTPTLWPDFSGEHLEQAVAEFHSRERRFGGLPQDGCAARSRDLAKV